MNSQPTLLEKSVAVSANRALYQRFMDLPRSERDQMQTDLENCGQWWHFKSHLTKEGNDLAEAKAKTVAILWYYLGVSLYDIVTNKVVFLPYSQFVQHRQAIEQLAD